MQSAMTVYRQIFLKKAKKTPIICENYSLNNSVFRQQKPLTETESKGCGGPLKLNKKRERYIGKN